jgi:PAS domain S-box-containing protein
MEKLISYLNFIKANHLEDAAKKSIKVSREMDFPLMRMFAHIPDEVLVPQSMKSIGDLVTNLQDGSYLEKQKESLQKWEDDKLEGISKNDIQPTDLVVIFAAQKKALHSFLPLYTKDPQLIIEIINELEELHVDSQKAGINMMFKWRKETEMKLQQTNDFLDAILENIPNMVFVKDVNELRFMRFNKAGEELLGYSSKDLIGKNDYDFFPREQADFFIAKDKEVIEQGKLLDVPEELITTLNKGSRWLHTKKIPVKDNNGKPLFMVGISDDITDRKISEQALRDSEERFRLLMNNVKDYAIYMVDEKGTIITWNKGAERIKGYTSSEVIGKNISMFYTAEELERGEPELNLKRAREIGNHESEGLRVRKDGSVFFADVILTALYDDTGKLRGFSKITRDITERKKSEEAILQLNKELEAFTYSVSHDLRAPLRAVSGYSNILEEEIGNKLDEEGKRLMGVIKYNAEKMGKLIDDLLAFSRLGRKEVEKTNEDMNKLVEGVLIDLSKSMAHKAKIKVDKLNHAEVDYGLMHQAMLNLISNAIKYSSKKSNSQVEISSKKSGNEIIFCVKDNGVGFDMKYAPKLFGVFQRLHSAEEFDGTGVGLAIVQRIVAKHNGRIWAEAKLNEGASFFVALPLN